MEHLHPQTCVKPKTRTRLSTTLASGVLVLLWLLATTAAHAAPKVKICHKPGAANQQILTISEAGLQDHFAHGDHVVAREVTDVSCIDEVDNDCDARIDISDPDCNPPCPSACEAALLGTTVEDHDYEGHIVEVNCSYDMNRRAGGAGVSARNTLGLLHIDKLFVSANRCYVEIAFQTLIDISLSSGEQRACAPIAAGVVELITSQECDITPP